MILCKDLSHDMNVDAMFKTCWCIWGVLPDNYNRLDMMTSDK